MKMLNLDNVELEISLDCEVVLVGPRKHVVVIVTGEVVLLVGIEILLLISLSHQVIRSFTLLVPKIKGLVSLNEILYEPLGRIFYILVNKVVFDISYFDSL